MTIQQSDVIDLIATAPDGTVALFIFDHLPWEPLEEHCSALLAKVNRYLAFVEEGQILEDYPQAQGRDLELRLVSKYRPTEAAVAFFERIAPEIETCKIRFAYGPIVGQGYEGDES